MVVFVFQKYVKVREVAYEFVWDDTIGNPRRQPVLGVKEQISVCKVKQQIKELIQEKQSRAMRVNQVLFNFSTANLKEIWK